jgi:hypothetical protein
MGFNKAVAADFLLNGFRRQYFNHWVNSGLDSSARSECGEALELQ